MYDDKTLSRFWSKVNKYGDCWEWIAGKGGNGYGAFWLKNRMYPAHRISWEINNSSIPKGTHVLHRCDNPTCVNPNHLFIGSHNDNMQDAIAKGRLNNKGSRHGMAKFNEQQIIFIRYMFSNGFTLNGLAKICGTSKTYIGDIVHRRRWRHIWPLKFCE